MYLDYATKTLNTMINLKKDKDYIDTDLDQLVKLTSYPGVWELKFKDTSFKMINIYNDDYVTLKYFWKDRYEQLSLNLWYEFTRDINAFHFDVGSHTGIYTIIGNLNKKINNIVSLEPYHINFSRMLSNLKLNEITLENSFMVAASNETGVAKFKTSTHIRHHTSAGSIQKEGNHDVDKTRLDDMIRGDQRVGSIKIDTEGHEYEVLLGSKNIITNFKPDIIFEINKACVQNCLNYLTEFGYSFFIIDDENNKLIPLTQANNSIKLGKEGINCLATYYTNKKFIKDHISELI